MEAVSWTAVIQAAIVAVPPTVMASAAFVRAKSADNAVNHRGNDQPRIVDMVESVDGKVDKIAAAVHHEETGIEALSGRLTQHLGWHQEVAERGTDEWDDGQ